MKLDRRALLALACLVLCACNENAVLPERAETHGPLPPCPPISFISVKGRVTSCWDRRSVSFVDDDGTERVFDFDRSFPSCDYWRADAPHGWHVEIMVFGSPRFMRAWPR